MKCNTKYYLSSCFWSRVVLILFLAMAAMSLEGCKSKKKLLAEQEAREQADMQVKIDKAKIILLKIINDDGSMTMEEKERQLAFIKQQNLNDPEVNRLIRQVEQQLLVERAALEEERKRKEDEIDRQKIDDEAEARKPRVSNFFNQIANSSTTESANDLISSALPLFASPDVPVLIIINENRNHTDYDEPTTISKYLHYLKDQQKNANRVHSLKVNSEGKITKLVLTKD